MERSDEGLEKLALEQDQYMDARAAELLNHDPELVELYHRNKKWKLGAKALQEQLTELIEAKAIALQVQNSINSYKNLSSRMGDALPDTFLRENIASDCAEAIEVAAESLKLLAVEIRGQIADLPPLDVRNADQLRKVEEAGFKAMMESFRKH